MTGYQSGPFRLDTARRRLFRDGVQVRLPAKAFDTLVALIERRDRVVEKDELIKLVWPGTFVTDDSLTTAISQLRRALGDEVANPQYIETAARLGYRFIGPIEPIAEPVDAAAGPSPIVELRRGPWPLRAAVAAAGLLALAAAAWLAAPRSDETPNALLVRFSLALPDGTIQISGGAPSPDGRQVAFIAREASGVDYLWVQSLETSEVRRLPGTAGAERPFWDPAGTALGFFAQSTVKAMKLADSMPRNVATAGAYASGGSINAAGTILFARRASPVYSVAGNGEPAAVTTLDRSARENAHRWPHFLPDGRRFLYTVFSDRAESQGVFLGSLDAPTKQRILDAPSSGAIYAPSGHLLFFRNGALLAQPFDAGSARLTGSATIIDAHVPAATPENPQALAAAAGELLSYATGLPERRLAWFSREGQRIGTVETPTVLKNLLLSPDRRRLLADSSDVLPGVWVVDLERGTRERVTDEGTLPVASPDGDIAFASRRSGGPEIYARSASPGTDRLVLAVDGLIGPTHWSPDGRFLVYETSSAATARDLWVHRADGTGEPTPILQTAFNEIQGEVSPDGRWIAYASDESGMWEVYVQAFPAMGMKRIVSVGGGAQPRWRGDGRELFYLAPDRRIMAASLDANASVSAAPVPLFFAPVEGELSAFRSHYVASEDGRRFLIDSTDTTSATGLSLVVHWTRLLRQ